MKFPWNDDYQGKITKEAWNNLIVKIVSLENKAKSLHDNLWKENNAIFENMYDETFQKLAEKIGLVSAIDPDLLNLQIHETAKSLAEMERRLDKLMAVLDLIPEHKQVSTKFREVMQEYHWLSDLQEIRAIQESMS